MLRFTLLLLLATTTSGCFLDTGLECGFFTFPEKAGSYTTHQIPNQYVALGDTLYLNINEYWNYEYKCDEYADYPYIDSFIADSREVELHRQENSIFIVGQKTGVFSATVIGTVTLTRKGKKNRYSVPMPFNIEVGTKPRDPQRQRATFPPAGRIDSVIVTGVDSGRKALRLLADFSPEYTSENISDLQANWAFYPVLDIDSLKQMGISLQSKHDFGNDYFFNPDSLYPFYYGYVDVRPGHRKFGKTFILDTRPYFE